MINEANEMASMTSSRVIPLNSEMNSSTVIPLLKLRQNRRYRHTSGFNARLSEAYFRIGRNAGELWMLKFQISKIQL